MRAALVVFVLASLPVEAGASHEFKAQVAAGLRSLSKVRIPSALRIPLAAALPPKVQVTTFEVKEGVATMTGSAPGFDDVSEFMRGLNDVVACPKGMARAIERKRDDVGWRVEVLESGAILEYSAASLRFFFAGVELKSTRPVGHEVTFTMTFPVAK